jgi:hypothetical protein
MNGHRPVSRWIKVAMFTVMFCGLGQVQAQSPEPAKGVKFPIISEADLKGWLTYLASDELEGREVFTEGYGIAAQFIAERLREWGVKPLGDHGSYFQIVKLRSYRVDRRSSVTIEGNGRSRTFKDGDHVRFPAVGGGRQTLVFDAVELAGSGRTTDLGGRDLHGQLIAVVNGTANGRPRAGQDAITPERTGAAATIEYRSTLPGTAAARGNAGPATQGRGARGGTGQAPAADIPPTTARVDGVVPPRLTADDEFFSALLSAASAGPADARERLTRGDALPSARLSAIKVTIDVNNTYEALTTQLTRNVAGIVEGSDPRLKGTYVMFGAHLDHVGYATSDQDAPGRVNTPIATDRIWNGADDDGTGSTAELAFAKAFATGPKPKRSVVFLWHAGEEANLYGSRFNADFPVVPLDKVQCVLNIDMIGRNRDDDPAQRNSVFVIGDDRISTDLHNLIVNTNAALPAPLKLDYEYNDPNDLNSFYTRSDHFSYASKGVPIAFFFTGTHRDYHANTDSVDKILFDKQARIAQLIYEVGFSVADSERELRRDNLGPRMGSGESGLLK